MGETTKIGWTNRTYNPWRGCRKVSAGCKNCYMFREQKRYGRDPTEVVRCSPATFSAPLKWDREVANGDPNRLVFTCSWSDFFIEEADPWRPEAWDVIRRTPNLVYQVLTKRPQNIRSRLPPDWGETGYPNVWLGVSGETVDLAITRGVELTRAGPARVRFLSAEPWLEREDITELHKGPGGDFYRMAVSAYDWVIIGGESGPHCRPMDEVSAIAMVRAAQFFKIPVFVKQLGGTPDARSHQKAILQGRTWTEMPTVTA